MLHTFLLIIHFFCAAAIIALVLIQRGKGAEAGAGFGAGASGTVFGARGASTALSRATAILAGVFMVTSLSLAYVGIHVAPASSSLLDRLSQPSAPASNAPATPAPPTAAPSGASNAAPNNSAPANTTSVPGATTAPSVPAGAAPAPPAVPPAR